MLVDSVCNAHKSLFLATAKFNLLHKPFQIVMLSLSKHLLEQLTDTTYRPTLQ